MSEANELRGEITLALVGAEYVLRPSYAALMAVEQQTGMSVVQLALAAGDRSLSIQHAAIVATECIKAQGEATGVSSLKMFNAQAVGEEIVDTGLIQVTARLATLLTLASTGGYDAKGELKAQAMTAVIPAAA